MTTLLRYSDANERTASHVPSELTHLQQQLRQLQEYDKQTQQQEITKLCQEIKQEMLEIQQRTDLSIEMKSALAQAEKVLGEFDQQLTYLQEDIKHKQNKKQEKNKADPAHESPEKLADTASSLKQHLQSLITKESTDKESIQLLGEAFASTTDAMRALALVELPKAAKIEQLSPDVRNTTASVIGESVLALYGKLLAISGGLTADYKVNPDGLKQIVSHGGSLQALYDEGIKKGVLSGSQQQLLETILKNPTLKTQREQQYRETIKPTLDNGLSGFVAEYDQASYSYKLSQRATNKGSEIMEGGKHLASKGLKGLEATGDRAIKHPVMAVVAGAGIYGVWNWLRGSSEKKSEETNDTEKSKKADKRTRLGWMNETFNPWNRGLLGKAAVVGGAGYLAIKAGNNLSPIWKEIQGRRGKPRFSGGEPQPKKTEEKTNKDNIEHKREDKRENKVEHNIQQEEKQQQKADKKKQEKQKRDYEQLPDVNQERIKVLAEQYGIPFISSREVREQMTLAGGDQAKIQAVLDAHHLTYNTINDTFLPAEGYTRQRAKHILGGIPLSSEDEKLIDTVNVMTIPSKQTEEKQKEQQKFLNKEEILVSIQECYPPTPEQLKGGIFDFGQEPREEPAFQSKLAEQVAKEQSAEQQQQQGILTYVVAGEVKNFYYYYDRSTKKIVIAENGHDLKEQINIQQVEKEIPTNKTAEQAKKTIDTIEAKIKELEADYKKIIEGKKTKLEEEIKKAEKEGKSPEEVQKMKEAGYQAISEEVGMHNTKMTYFEKAAVRCMLSIPDAQLPKLIKISPKAGAIAKANNRTTNILNKSFSKTALRAGGVISIGMNLWNVASEGGMKNAGTVALETALELTPFAGGVYLIQKGYSGKGMTGDLTWGERVAASATGLGSLVLDFFGFGTLGLGNGLSAGLKIATKAPKITKAITQGAKVLVRGQSAYLGYSIGSSLYTASVPLADLGIDVTKNIVYGKEKHHNHSNDAINK